MVALLVLGTIVACLLVDGIVLMRRESKVATSPVLTPVLVFAQDGGEEVENKENKEED